MQWCIITSAILKCSCLFVERQNIVKFLRKEHRGIWWQHLLFSTLLHTDSHPLQLPMNVLVHIAWIKTKCLLVSTLTLPFDVELCVCLVAIVVCQLSNHKKSALDGSLRMTSDHRKTCLFTNHKQVQMHQRCAPHLFPSCHFSQQRCGMQERCNLWKNRTTKLYNMFALRSRYIRLKWMLDDFLTI